MMPYSGAKRKYILGTWSLKIWSIYIPIILVVVVVAS